ncbi:MAG: XdhC family protein, partial [Woeseiaceae bacterium]
MKRWIDSLRLLRENGEDAVLVTVMDVRGSAPRECGAKMLVTATDLIGTIGGGQLEYQCTKLACQRLREPGVAKPQAVVQRFPLGSNCGQCCGGVVEVLFEKLSAGNAAWISDLFEFYDQRIPVVIATALATGEPQKFLVTAEECRAYGATPRELRAVVAKSAHVMFAHPADAHRLRVKEPENLSLLLEPLMSSQFN